MADKPAFVKTMADKQKIIIYTDGGARGNPGPAAIGVVIKDEKENLIKSYSEKIGEKTNNEAEYEAIIFALKKAKHLFGKEKVKNMNFEIRTDSELAARQLQGKYKIEEERLFPLFIKIWNGCGKMDIFAHIGVYGRSGNKLFF